MSFLKKNYFYLIVGAIVATFFSLFLFESFNYVLYKDDEWYKELVAEKGLLNSIAYLFMEVNGRWFSHIWDCIIFELFIDHYQLLFIYHLFLLLLFILALTLFVRVLFQKQNSITLPYLKTFFLSICLSSLFFFFLFEGRLEIWYWVCATGVHLLSLIALLIVLSYCIKDNLKVKEIALLVISAITIGGMSESYAIMGVLLLLFGIYKQFLELKRTILIMIVIISSLMINVLSSGMESRLNMLPDFDLLLAIRNTIHSLLLPFINYQYLPLKIGVLIITYLLASRSNRLGIITREKFLLSNFFIQFLYAIGIISISFFIPCFLLTDIIAYRMESFAYLFLLLFVFNYFTKYDFGHINKH